MRIQDVMTRDPKFVTPDTPAREAARIMRDSDIGIVPVVESASSRRLLGVVTDRDICLRVVSEGKSHETLVSDVMSKAELATCRPDNDIEEAMDTMASEQVRRIPIVDERGSLVGIVAQADVARKSSDNSKTAQTVESISKPGGLHSR
ncbi:MAG TPA: CBS domain-containing protein [Gemmatimonadaceae bacterium]|nr:CBS domain-containing protein [Gemmatimonadaceae bacterium]